MLLVRIQDNMFADGDSDSAFGTILHSLDHGNTHPPFLQRSISAPAIAEHVSEIFIVEIFWTNIDLQVSDALLPESDYFDVIYYYFKIFNHVGNAFVCYLGIKFGTVSLLLQ